jgi:hypothetical protein
MIGSPAVDVAVIGAGFVGLYSTQRVRNLLGLMAQSYEAGSGHSRWTRRRLRDRMQFTDRDLRRHGHVGSCPSEETIACRELRSLSTPV